MQRRRNMKGLRPWRPGISGNPHGRPRDIGKQLGFMPREEFLDLVSLLFQGTLAEIQKVARSRTRPAMHILVARAILGDIRRREFKNGNRLLNYLIGKPATVIEHLLVCKRCGVTWPLE